MEYIRRTTHIPAILIERDGMFYVQIVEGNSTVLAPVGREFVADLFRRMILSKVPNA